MDFGMQRLDAAVEDFGVAGEGGNIDDGQACVAQGGGGAAGGQELDAERGEAAGEVEQAGFVGYAEQCALDLHDGAEFCHAGGGMGRLFAGNRGSFPAPGFPCYVKTVPKNYVARKNFAQKLRRT